MIHQIMKPMTSTYKISLTAKEERFRAFLCANPNATDYELAVALDIKLTAVRSYIHIIRSKQGVDTIPCRLKQKGHQHGEEKSRKESIKEEYIKKQKANEESRRQKIRDNLKAKNFVIGEIGAYKIEHPESDPQLVAGNAETSTVNG